MSRQETIEDLYLEYSVQSFAIGVVPLSKEEWSPEIEIPSRRTGPRDFEYIIEYLRTIILRKSNDLSKKVLDVEVAKELQIKYSAFSSRKKRNSIPYKQIIEFAYKNKINPNEILYFDGKLDNH